MTYQQMIIVGNVGRDPELRYTQSGIAVCDFSVAVNKNVGSGADKRKETTWFRVTCWRQLAELVNQYVKSGQQIMVIGEVKSSAYLDKAGQPAATLELTANDIRFLSRRDDNAGGPGGGPRNQYDDFAPPSSGSNQVDDIPF
ncbi:MAG: single-stranded DNA-binding protein [Anaerolineae bacterium]|jgi:single-strand DNA-binding protein|nr:single-stranded DNA-binding protein [Anaerolineae bacterium]